MLHLFHSLERYPYLLTMDDFLDGNSNERIWPQAN
jgi:hypothetical protein